MTSSLWWRHNGRDSVSNHQPHDCLLNRLFRHRSKKTSKLRVTGLCAGNSPGTGEFPAQIASNAENVSIWWRHHVSLNCALYISVSNNCFRLWCQIRGHSVHVLNQWEKMAGCIQTFIMRTWVNWSQLKCKKHTANGMVSINSGMHCVYEWYEKKGR